MTRRLIAITFAVFSLLFLIGAFIEPFMTASLHLNLPSWVPLQNTIKEWVLNNSGFAIGKQYLTVIIRDIFKTQPILGIAVFFFSIVIPIVKSSVCLYEAIMPNENRIGAHIITFIAKWSMADVFIVALVVVFFKAEKLTYKIEPAKGFWFFFASVVASMISAEILTNQWFNKKRTY